MGVSGFRMREDSLSRSVDMNVVDCKPRVSARKTSCWKMFLLALGTPQAKPRNGLIQLQVEKVKKKKKKTLKRSVLLPGVHVKKKSTMIAWLGPTHEGLLTRRRSRLPLMCAKPPSKLRGKQCEFSIWSNMPVQLQQPTGLPGNHGTF